MRSFSNVLQFVAVHSLQHVLTKVYVQEAGVQPAAGFVGEGWGVWGWISSRIDSSALHAALHICNRSPCTSHSTTYDRCRGVHLLLADRFDPRRFSGSVELSRSWPGTQYVSVVNKRNAPRLNGSDMGDYDGSWHWNFRVGGTTPSDNRRHGLDQKRNSRISHGWTDRFLSFTIAFSTTITCMLPPRPLLFGRCYVNTPCIKEYDLSVGEVFGWHLPNDDSHIVGEPDI